MTRRIILMLTALLAPGGLVAGFALIEAASITEAVELASQTPCSVAHGVVEVWPLQEA